MSALVAVALDPGLATHLAVAIRTHRKRCEREGWPEPPGLRELEELAVAAATGRHETPATAAVPAPGEDAVDDHRDYLDTATIGRLTGKGRRTVQRWIAPGRDGSPPRLPSVRVGGSRLVARAELARFLST